MTGGDLPDGDHIVRYVKPTLIEDDVVDGSAFLLRMSEDGLSVNWLEAFEGDKHTQLHEVRRLSRLKLAKNGQFAQLNVGNTKRHVSENAEEMGVGIAGAALGPLDDFEADPSHAKITGLPSGDSDEAMLIGDLIAECVMYPLHSGKAD